MRIVVLGATGAAGQHVVGQALTAGHRVVAYVRRPEKMQKRPGLTIVGGTLDDVPAMTAAITGTDAVISCLGAKLTLASMRNSDLMQRALSSIITAMTRSGVNRLVLMSAFGVGHTSVKASTLARLLYRTIVSAIYRDKERAEISLLRSGLNWTTIYPVILEEAPHRQPVIVKRVEEVDHVAGLPKVPYSDVAAILIDLARDLDRSEQRLIVTTGALSLRGHASTRSSQAKPPCPDE